LFNIKESRQGEPTKKYGRSFRGREGKGENPGTSIPQYQNSRKEKERDVITGSCEYQRWYKRGKKKIPNVFYWGGKHRLARPFPRGWNSEKEAQAERVPS